jgi:hypothetical protein
MDWGCIVGSSRCGDWIEADEQIMSIFCGLEGLNVVVWFDFSNGLVMGFFLWSYSCRSAEGEDCRGGSELWESI